MSKFIRQLTQPEIEALTPAVRDYYVRKKNWDFVTLMLYTQNTTLIEEVIPNEHYILHFTSVSSFDVYNNDSFTLNMKEVKSRVSGI